MRRHGLLLERRARHAPPTRRHDGKVAVDRSNVRWCSDSFEFRCDDGAPLRVVCALDCCDREAMSWAATTSGYTGDMVRDVMLQAIESRFAGALKADSEIEWLSDNGSCYIADETLTFSREIGLKPVHDTGQKSAEQWDGRELRQNDEARLRVVDAQARRRDRTAKPGHCIRPLQRVASA